MSDTPEKEAEVVDLDIEESDLESSDPTGGGGDASFGSAEGGR